MADAAKRAEKNIRQIAECSICMNGFTDPRVLPCIHTFCLECIKHTVESAQKTSGDTMPCPLCRKEFTIPREGITGLQINFFMESLMENLMEFKSTLQDIDPDLKFEIETKEEIKRITKAKSCLEHTLKPLDYYCADCKNIVCISCFVESHKLHNCKDVASFDAEFRQMIERNSWQVSNFAEEMLLLKKNAEMRRLDFLKKIVENETAIINRSQELQNMLIEHTKSLLDELSAIKSCHLKQMEDQMEEIARYYTILISFEAYCNELTQRGSASDICSSVDQLLGRAAELEKDHEAYFLGRAHHTVELSFQATDLGNILQDVNSNFVGKFEETITRFESCAVVVGLDDGPHTARNFIKINLHRSNEISAHENVPTIITIEPVAAVYCNTMYVTGLGFNEDEIWKYNAVSGWMKCASLVRARRRHSAAFIDGVLYICGGYVGQWKFEWLNRWKDGLSANERVQDSVEAYNTVADKCTTVGKLVHCVQNSGNCVPFNNSLYIFGGRDIDRKPFSHVQVYNTEQNTCTLLTNPLPCSYSHMQAVIRNSSVILVGNNTCFIFNVETETWQERNQFKTEVDHFGLVMESERLFVIGGGNRETDKDGNTTWKYRDDVRYVPLQNIIDDKPIEWKIHGKLPEPCLVHAYAKLTEVIVDKAHRPMNYLR